MAKFVWTDAFFSINAVDLSARVKKVVLDIKIDEVEVTTMGNSGYREFLSGFRDYAVDIDFAQDFAAAQVDVTVFPLVGTSQAVVLRPVRASAVGTSNPEYRATMAVLSYKPIDALIGSAAMATLHLGAGGTLTRNTT